MRAGLSEQFANYEFGNPAATADAILKVVDSTAPPLRLALGAGTIAHITVTYEERLATWESWKTVSVAAQG
jgi:hypothetical protein